MEFGRVLIIDGSYYLNRALSVKQFWDMTNGKGERIGGIYGFLRSMYSTIQHFNYYPVVVFDNGISLHRTRIYPEYKHNPEREISKTVELTEAERLNNFGIQLIEQKNKLIPILQRLGIPVIMEDGYEGDDLIYYVSRLCNDCIVCSEDRDMWQMLSDTCRVYLPKSKILLDRQALTTLYGYDSAYDFVMQKVILGDKSDNIPSCCKGVGEKNVKSLLKIILPLKESLIDNSYDFSVFDAKVLCELAGVTYKSAYSNFSISQFNINLELICLDKLPKNEELLSEIKSIIKDCTTWINPISVMEQLDELEITDFDVKEIVCSVSNLYSNLYNNNYLF